MKIEKKNLEQIRAFYGKKYVKIFDALENVGATNFKIDEDCGKWIELWCDIKNKHIKINIGLDNKFRICKNYFLDCYDREIFNSQTGVADYINSTYSKKL